jgi:SAM-dependent methyltransferase
MAADIEPWYFRHLACPDCGHPLAISAPVASCTCGYIRPLSLPLDLRPMSPSPRTLTVHLSTSAPQVLSDCLVERPANTYAGPSALRDSSELFSAVSASFTNGNALLDLGCGPRDQALPAQHFGLRYVGVDFSSSTADILADAHALPFQEHSFDLALSYAVLEHLYNPFLAVREVTRVLKPGGLFFGTVSQGEPFHNSFFHHTSWGLLHVCQGAGLRVNRLWYSYDTLRALAVMGRYPKLGRFLISLVDRFLDAAPALSPRKHFRWSRREREIDALHRAASICFVAQRPGEV